MSFRSNPLSFVHYRRLEGAMLFSFDCPWDCIIYERTFRLEEDMNSVSLLYSHYLCPCHFQFRYPRCDLSFLPFQLGRFHFKDDAFVPSLTVGALCPSICHCQSKALSLSDVHSSTFWQLEMFLRYSVASFFAVKAFGLGFANKNKQILSGSFHDDAQSMVGEKSRGV